MAMIGEVRRLHFRQQKSVREIARITSLSRNAVRKWLRTPVTGEPKYQRGSRPGKLTAFHEILLQALKADDVLSIISNGAVKQRFDSRNSVSLQAARGD